MTIAVGDLVKVPKDAQDEGGDGVFEEYADYITWEPVFKVLGILEDEGLVKIENSTGDYIYVRREYVTAVLEDERAEEILELGYELDAEPEEDPVRQPGHYKGEGGMEAIDVIEAFELNYRLGNAQKYLLRAGKKGDAIQDLSKAVQYITREINALKGQASW